MAAFRENRISIVDLFPFLPAWSKRERKTKRAQIIPVNYLCTTDEVIFKFIVAKSNLSYGPTYKTSETLQGSQVNSIFHNFFFHIVSSWIHLFHSQTDDT